MDTQAIIATPVQPLVAEDGVGTEREILAVISTGLGEPLEVLNTANAWWLDIGKVEKLLEAAKLGMTVEETCNIVHISRDQYYYFLKIHPAFSDIKATLGGAMTAQAKLTLAEGIKHDAQLALRYLQGVQPEAYKRTVMPDLPPGAGGYARRTEELFTDSEGKVIVKRQTAELMEKYGDE